MDLELEEFWSGNIREYSYRGFSLDIFKHNTKREYIVYICNSSESCSWTIKTAYSTIRECKERGIEFIDKREYLNY